MKRTTVIFEKPGKEHTEETLRVALEAAKERGIDTVVVSTTTGTTGEKAVEVFKGSRIKLVFVTHQSGYRGSGIQLVPAETRKKLEKTGTVVTCTDVLTGGVDVGMGRQRPEVSEPQQGSLPFIVPPVNVLVANTLRLFSQGVKVCAEVAMMAADCGAVQVGKPVVCVAGSHAGADTAMVISPAESNRMRDLKLHEILAKPN
ncbi:hypothetical protein MUO93_04430 [Candidatus Bathyarchaeota archaeon]|nr:hypothetical protein [Candidatus Bathyarchaeota archaeon]